VDTNYDFSTFKTGPIFPHPDDLFLQDVVAFGGNLSPMVLLEAYHKGIFPWFNPGEEILWWCPMNRGVIFKENLRIHKSMNTYFNNNKFQVTFNTQFKFIIDSCGAPRKKQNEPSWIQPSLIKSYEILHKLGYAHSVEVWQGDKIVGGLYGLTIGGIFCGESMFSTVANSSKFGFLFLAKKLFDSGFVCIDCQVLNDHTASLGGLEIPRKDFLKILKKSLKERLQFPSLK
jgi:leucyl/phenylalanyl-tRNA---protein transferase